MKTLDEQIAEEELVGEQPTEELESIIEPDLIEEKPVDPVIETKPETSLNPNPMAQMGWELRETKRQLKDLQDRQNTPVQAAPIVKEDPEPDANEFPVENLQWHLRNTRKELEDTRNQVKEVNDWRNQTEAQRKQAEVKTNAIREFQEVEKQFASKVPDYEAVSAHMANQLFQAERMASPFEPIETTQARVQDKLLTWASHFYNQGQDPAESLYQMSKTTYGYKELPPEEPEAPTYKKPDLKVIEKNKAKSANGLGGQSKGATPTVDQIAKMSLADMDRMDQNELASMIGT